MLSSGGGYYYKDHSLAFLAPALTASLTGNPLGAYRSAVSLTCVLLILSGVAVAFTAATASGLEKRTVTILGVLTITVLGCAFTIYEFCFEYYKNAFAVLLLVSAALIPLSARSGLGLKGKLSVLLLVLSALLSHKSALLFCVLFGVIWFVRNASRRNLLMLISICAAGIAVFLVIFERGRQYLSALPSFFGPPRRWFEWFSYTMRNDAALSVAMAAALSFLVLYLLRRRLFPTRLTLLFDTICVSIIIAFIPLLIPGPSGPGYRIILVSPVFTVPLLLLSSITRRQTFAAAGAILLSAFLVQLLFGHPRIAGDFPAWSSLDKDVMLITRHVTPRDYLIAHHGLEFYVDYRTGIRARQFLASGPQKRSFRLAYVPDGRPGGRARAALERVKLEQIGDRYALFREEDWQRIAVRYGIKPHWKNPTMVKPDYIPDYD